MAEDGEECQKKVEKKKRKSLAQDSPLAGVRADSNDDAHGGGQRVKGDHGNLQAEE